MESTFASVAGVVETSVGFMGGRTDNPTYEAVCVGNTGHVEVVQLCFDPSVVSYNELLDLFWTLHEPTLSSNTGFVGSSQYRPVIFYHSPEQQALAQLSKKFLQIQHRDPIATGIEAAGPYYLAGDEHQHYEAKQRKASRRMDRNFGR